MPSKKKVGSIGNYYASRRQRVFQPNLGRVIERTERLEILGVYLSTGAALDTRLICRYGI